MVKVVKEDNYAQKSDSHLDQAPPVVDLYKILSFLLFKHLFNERLSIYLGTFRR